MTIGYYLNINVLVMLKYMCGLKSMIKCHSSFSLFSYYFQQYSSYKNVYYNNNYTTC